MLYNLLVFLTELQVPTVAIETIYIQQNTSIIQDEVLAHRIGLVPINVDPNLFDDIGEDDEPTDLNTLVFRLDVFVKEPTDSEKPLPGSSRKYTQGAFSGDLEWQPQGDQAEKFPGKPQYIQGHHVLSFCIVSLLYWYWY